MAIFSFQSFDTNPEKYLVLAHIFFLYAVRQTTRRPKVAPSADFSVSDDKSHTVFMKLLLVSLTAAALSGEMSHIVVVA